MGAAGKSADIHVIVKIESADSIPNLQSILDAADGVSLYSSGAYVDVWVFRLCSFMSVSPGRMGRR